MSEWLTPAEGFAGVAKLGRKIEIDELFGILARAAADVERAIRTDDDDLGEHASSALLNALALFPEPLRDSMHAALNREGIAEHLLEIAL